VHPSAQRLASGALFQRPCSLEHLLKLSRPARGGAVSAQPWIGRTGVIQIGAPCSQACRSRFPSVGPMKRRNEGCRNGSDVPQGRRVGTPYPWGVTLGLPRPAWNLKASQPRLWPAQESETPRRHPRRRRKPEAHSSQVPNRNKRS